MQILFKNIGTSHKVPVEVSATDFANHYAGVNKSMAWAELEPSVRQATEKYVLPYVGEEMYDVLAADYQDSSLDTDAKKKIVQHLKDAIASYAIYHAIPLKTGVVSSQSIHQNQGEATTPLPQWAWHKIRQEALDNADFFLEKALAFLEAQVVAEVSYFDPYKNSTAYTTKASDFFRRTADLDDYLNIQNSRRTFVSLIRYIRQAEQDHILPLLCTDLYDTIKANDNLTALQTKLLKLVKKAAANLGLVEAIPHHRVVIEPDGFRFVSIIDGITEKRSMTNSFQRDSISGLQQKAQETGRKALADALSLLRSNEDEADFEDWKNSDCYTAVPDTSHSIVASPDKKGGIAIF